MGMCDYCGKKPADLEVIDDSMDNGMAMVCRMCHPNPKLMIEQLEADLAAAHARILALENAVRRLREAPFGELGSDESREYGAAMEALYALVPERPSPTPAKEPSP